MAAPELVFVNYTAICHDIAVHKGTVAVPASFTSAERDRAAGDDFNSWWSFNAVQWPRKGDTILIETQQQ